MDYRTEQEAFWAGDFGNEYLARNQGEKLINTNVVQWGKMLKSTNGIKSFVELGCNIGLNLSALNRINPEFDLHAYEINPTAAQKASALGIAKVTQGTIIEKLPTDRQFDLAFTSGVLIHINPDELGKVYDNLYNLSSRYVLVFEYYNPTPMEVKYRGHEGRLFKRDFAGELMDRHGLRLVDYGFSYHRDNYFPQDDATWFLLEK